MFYFNNVNSLFYFNSLIQAMLFKVPPSLELWILDRGRGYNPKVQVFPEAPRRVVWYWCSFYFFYVNKFLEKVLKWDCVRNFFRIEVVVRRRVEKLEFQLQWSWSPVSKLKGGFLIIETIWQYQIFGSLRNLKYVQTKIGIFTNLNANRSPLFFNVTMMVEKFFSWK